MRNFIQRTVAVLAVSAVTTAGLASAAGATEAFCVYVDDWTIICIEP